MDAHLNAGVSSHLVDDFLSCENMDGGAGVSLEWLSTFVEDCFNSEGFTSQPLPLIPTQSPINPIVSATQSSSKSSRTKRRKTNGDSTNPNCEFNSIPSSDPTLLPQPHWLAESELLIFPQKEEAAAAAAAAAEKATMVKISVDDDGGGDHDDDHWGDEAHGINGQRRCTHCGSYKTPQWRAGPLGPKTLCNACGVRFKSGRLLPEYRPARSPTFESFKHSNSHKKVMEMRATSIKLA